MKLIIQIPCFNEETTLKETISDIPKEIEGVDLIEILVVDDGSTDKTVEVATECGVHHILSLGSNCGLATAFRKGSQYALQQGADILVNTDADNQYYGGDIPKLVKPIIDSKADLVIGCRPIKNHPEFNPVKKILQLLGSWTLRQISKTEVRDAASRFRAFSRETCQRIFIHSRFSYCMETLIQAGNIGLRVVSVDIKVNPKTRESRLFKSIPQYIKKSGGTMLMMFILYRPGRFFLTTATPFILLSLGIGFRFIYLVYWSANPDPTRTYLPSLILLAVCSIASIVFIALAIIGEIMNAQRRLTEENLFLNRYAMDKNDK
jgi:glycosyltransferase involved in cell wall biosynthesis